MDEEKPVMDYLRSPRRKRGIKRGPLIAFCIMLVVFSLVPYFVSEAAWSRGVGDLMIFAALLVLCYWFCGMGLSVLSIKCRPCPQNQGFLELKGKAHIV
jgi:hypothetical protein